MSAKATSLRVVGCVLHVEFEFPSTYLGSVNLSRIRLATLYYLALLFV